MSIDFPAGTSTSAEADFRFFPIGHDFGEEISFGFTYSPTNDAITSFVNESADDGSADGAYSSLLSTPISWFGGTGSVKLDIGISTTFLRRTWALLLRSNLFWMRL
jgi:hypothetical protein